MDRARTVTWSERASVRRGPADEFVLPSRGEMISGLVSALETRGGLVLLTGEPGVGKTWACRKLREAMPACWRWVAVDLSPSIEGGEFVRLVLHALGHDRSDGPAGSRAALRDILADGTDDGRLWGLIVEEGHNASPGVLEELRILGNRTDEPGVFEGMVLVGQSALARRMATRPLAALSARVTARSHLRPFDVEELRTWVTHLEHGRAWDDDSVERLHRETAGNPRRVLTLAGRTYVPASATIERTMRAETAPARAFAGTKPEPPAPARIPDCETPPVAPGKPPLRVGEGMIEVGWEPTPDPERGLPVSSSTTPEFLNSPKTRSPEGTSTSGSVEVIDDHYAALQAWTEWAQNQGREPVAGTDEAAAGLSPHPGETQENPDPEESPQERLSGLAGVRVEAQHDFAPYSQLFSRLRQTCEGQ